MQQQTNEREWNWLVRCIYTMTPRSKKPKCSDLSDAQEQHVRDLVSQVADKWPLWVLHALYENRTPLRFARLLERIDGVSQKMLTQTLRQLERDGLVTRTIYPEIPPRVEYELTQDGQELMEQFLPLWYWLAERLPRFERARARFDGVDHSPSAGIELLQFTCLSKQ